jgi:protein-S-isoprenylcysteine O-methyltransferase Ste14
MILVVALFLGWQARVAFEKEGGQVADENWLYTRVVVASGVYAVVRHPMYFSFALIAIAFICLSQNWLALVMGVVLVGLLYNDMYREEKSNIEKFGEKYRHYMETVPRANVFLGIIRLMQRKK